MRRQNKATVAYHKALSRDCPGLCKLRQNSRSALFWVVTQRIVVIRYRRFGITNLRCVTTQKSADPIYIAAEAGNHDKPHSAQPFSGLGLKIQIYKQDSFFLLLHSPSYDSFTASPKANSTHSAIQCFLFQFIPSPRFLMVIR